MGDGFPGIITTEGCPYKTENSYNSVLSFGFGGTNACAACWGPNQMTTRMASAKDMYSAVIQRLSEAPAQEVTVNRDDWEDWEMEGPDRFSKANDRWQFEVDEDNEVTYEKIDKAIPDVGDSFYLSGSFNDWDYDSMESDISIEGLFSVSITIGESGTETFQVVAEMDPEMTFYPAMEYAGKAAAILGPGKTGRDQAWCINGT